MVNGHELQGFEVVDVAVTRYAKGVKKVSMICDRGQLYVSSAVAKDLNWENGERLTLLKLGKTFALMPGKVNNRVGDLTAVCKYGKKSKTYQISSRSMCDKIYWATDKSTKFEAWADTTEDGRTILFFKPEDEE